MHCWTKTLEKHGKHFFLWLFLSVYQSGMCLKKVVGLKACYVCWASVNSSS